MVLRTAKEWQVSPSRFLGLAGKWGEVDSLLASALTLHEAMLCPGGCGQYVDEAHDDVNDGAFVIDDKLVCHACAAKDEWSRGDRPEPGAIPRLVNQRRVPRVAGQPKRQRRL